MTFCKTCKEFTDCDVRNGLCETCDPEVEVALDEDEVFGLTAEMEFAGWY